jgi:hypothetical protein
MTYVESEDVLRQALQAAADSVEPSSDGLAQIRSRLTTPRPLVIAWLTGAWDDLRNLLTFRLAPALAALAGRVGFALTFISRPLHPAARRLRPVLVRMQPAFERLRPAANRLGAWAGHLGRLVRGPGAEPASRSRYAWLRPAIAMAAVVLVAVAGGFALSGLPHQISQVAASLLPSQTNTTGKGGHGPKLNGNGHALGGGAAGQRGFGTNPSPFPSCSPSRQRGKTTPKSATTPKPTASPTVTPSPSPSISPSPTPTPTASPSPTNSAAEGGSAPDVVQNSHVAADFVLASPSPQATASPTPECTPRATPTAG